MSRVTLEGVTDIGSSTCSELDATLWPTLSVYVVVLVATPGMVVVSNTTIFPVGSAENVSTPLLLIDALLPLCIDHA